MSQIDMTTIPDNRIWYRLKTSGGPGHKDIFGFVTQIFKGGTAAIVLVDALWSGGTWDLQDVSYGADVGQWRFMNPPAEIEKIISLAVAKEEKSKPKEPDTVLEHKPAHKPKADKEDAFFDGEPEPQPHRKPAAKASRL